MPCFRSHTSNVTFTFLPDSPHSVRQSEVRSCCYKWHFHSFLWLSNAPRVCVCVCVRTTSLSLPPVMSICVASILTVADSSAWEIKVHVNTLGLQFSADTSLEMELLDHIVALFFVILYFLLHYGNSRILHFLLMEYILKKET